ncbi:MAG: FecR domain-containing protein [Ferruginibacter sp.]|nr:FecR domain-containing protein [Ferruginibacter sp.]
MTVERIQYLTQLFFDNTITGSEKKELAGWIKASKDNEEISKVLSAAWHTYQLETIMPDEISEKILSTIFSNTEEAFTQGDKNTPVININSTKKWWRVAIAAASVVFFIGMGYRFLQPTDNRIAVKNKPAPSQIGNDVKPGANKAILTLSNGSQIVLDSASNGLLAKQGNARITKLPGGEITYNTNGLAAKEILYNTMTTPIGGLYQLLLPDGSKVWLNSASAIRYPTQFFGSERRVEITGEAYFEVTKNASMPFTVKVNNNTSVQVLGTHFNINAYSDEAEIKTTLLQGVVKISRGSSSSLLKPGQQAQINKNGSIKVIPDADMEEAVAWKNGNFQFNSADIATVLRQASRWYDIEIVYAGNKIPDDKFSGKISRAVNLSSLLKWMQWSDVHFKLEGKKLIIQP